MLLSAAVYVLREMGRPGKDEGASGGEEATRTIAGQLFRDAARRYTGLTVPCGVTRGLVIMLGF